MASETPQEPWTSHRPTGAPSLETEDAPVDPGYLRQRLDTLVRDSLDAVGGGVTLIYLVAGVGYLLFLPAPSGPQVFLIDVGAAVFFLALFLWRRYGEVPVNLAHPVMGGLAVVALASIYLNGSVYPSATVPIYYVLVTFALGSYLLDPRWFLMSMGATVVAWTASVLRSGGGPAIDLTLTFVASVLLTSAVFLVRYRTYRNLEALQVRHERRNRALHAAMEEAEENERRVRTVVRSAPLILFAVDEKGRFVLGEGRGLASLGIEPGELTGVSVDDFYADQPEILAHVHRALDGEEVHEEVEVGGRAFDVVYTPVRENGRVARVLGVALDVTDRVEARRSLERYAAELELTNQDLESFATAAAHDLQEPLRSVAGYLQLLERRYPDSLDAEGREFLGFAVDAAHQMKALVDGLLTYSRVPGEALPRGPADVGQVLEGVLASLRGRLEASGGRVTRDDELPSVAMDPGLLHEVLQNLVANALIYHGDDPPRVHVGAQRRDGGWAISVTDEGEGIAPRHQVRVFEIFQRLHPRGRDGGSGIGLALVKRIVERYGGRVSVESAPGAGSTFTILVPDREVPDADRPPGDAAEDPRPPKGS